MFLRPLKFVFLSSFGLSFILGNSVVLAQLVVPTIPSDSTSTPTGTTTSTPTVTSGNRFSCQFYNGQHTVMYQPQNIPGQFFPWAAPAALGGGWSPQKRCQAIASRLESYRPDGLDELQIAVENNENIICVTTQTNSFCRIVLTIPRGKDPYVVRNSVFQNLISADNGEKTIAVNTYRHRNTTGVSELYNLGRTLFGGGKNRVAASKGAINLKPYLAPQDGGTLGNTNTNTNQSAPQTPTRLNPGNFR
ncbi:COP23 domain-containing protein [Umezakia ovalisporum]|jgi:hypothetical protein|uniref:COP23 domain-containing protein n=1 Tax=Umezakia ovalisporum TaxID=75695 RepID=UPI0024757695|nr:COP23 domain-containing protein [Umezakia ovalisporum]MBI1241333.1 hypothetical protein [Nostoc sp. RI_552]MDH6084093.1 COP23 domain-containing protein [Umezakia ovalisporum TAC611]